MFENFNIWMCFNKMLDALLLAFIPWKIFGVRNSWDRYAVLVLPFLVMFIVLYSVEMLLYPVNFMLTLAVHIVMGMTYAHLFLQGRFHLKLILQCACTCCTMLFHFMIVKCLTEIRGSFMLFSWGHVLIMALLSVLLAWYMVRFCYIPKLRLSSGYGIGMTALMTALLLITNAMETQTLIAATFWVDTGTTVIILAVVLYVYFLFFNMIREYEGNQLIQQQLELQKAYMEENVKTYNDMRHLRHELKNHVFYSNYLLEQKEYAKLAAYFKEVYQREYQIDTIESGNNIINAVLNQKSIHARLKGISLRISATVPEALNIDEGHVCAVISNLLDNAIEACEAVSNPEASITIRIHGSYLYICCKNTTAYDVLKRNRTLTTTKRTGWHGMGLQVVKNIVASYDGMVDFHMENLTFVVDVMLRNEVFSPLKLKK